MLVLVVVLCALFLAYANGSNDNFKGVATLYGSGTVGYRGALAWATVTTLAGSVTAAFFATRLIAAFSGKGLVPDALTHAPAFALAVVLGAAVTVVVASRFGVPISTTHSITGALAGAGWLAAGSDLNVGALAGTFVLPLLVSPLLATALAAGGYAAGRGLRVSAGLDEASCVCVTTTGDATLEMGTDAAMAMGEAPAIRVANVSDCRIHGASVRGVVLSRVMSAMHFASGGAVSFARGLNDTPKVVAVALVATAAGLPELTFVAALAMATGGLLNAGRVAHTMSRRVTKMNTGQGLAANLVTSFLVIVASRFGLPVSTTHVSCGALFGIGVVGGRADRRVVAGIATAWALTLPLAAIVAGLAYLLIRAAGVPGPV